MLSHYSDGTLSFRYFLGIHVIQSSDEEDEGITEETATEAEEGGSAPQLLSAGLRRILRDTLPSVSSMAVLEPSMALADLGADSMALARLAAAIKERFGVTVLLPQLVKMPSLLHLQIFIFSGGTALLGGMLNEVKATTTEKGEGEECNKKAHVVTSWHAEVNSIWEPLEKSLQNLLGERVGEGGEKEGQDGGEDILLTGASGFYGAFLLHELLCHPAFQKRKVICIVRAKSREEAFKRLEDNLRHYLLWQEEFSARIYALAGDVAQEPAMGLSSEEDYSFLEKHVNLIVHNAAVVNSVLPYASLRGSNVIATCNILRLAARTGAVLHHVSTIGLLAGSGVQQEAEEVPSTALSLLSGYAQSKWVAERLVLRAVKKMGMPCYVYRPGTLSGDSRTGACNAQDTVTRMLLGLAKEKIYCLDEDSPLPNTFPLIPTDWAASALVHIAASLGGSSTSSTKERVYHIVNRNPQTLEGLVEGLRAFGVDMRAVDAEEFRARIADVEADHPLYVFKSVLSYGGYASGSAKTMPDDTNTRSALAQASATMPSSNHPKDSCPFFTTDMLVLMLRYCYAK